MSNICVIGHFGEGLNLLNGQTIKTKMVTEQLEIHFGRENVSKIDTHGGMKTLCKAPFQVIKALKDSKHVIMLPAHNGLRIYGPLLRRLRPLFKNRSLHYAVIGGWLPNFLSNKKWLERDLKKFDSIYVETNTMRQALELKGFKNIYVMPNFKDLQAVSSEDLAVEQTKTYKLCTFSRVMKEKGIEDIVNAVQSINNTLCCEAYTLDIYGQVDSAQEEWFDELQNSFPTYIRYCGCVDASESVSVLKDYFSLVFPTKFFTEGVPGTIIDAYAAGLPVISSKWASFNDIVDENLTGYGYQFDNQAELEGLLHKIYNNPDLIYSIKANCIAKAKRFMPNEAMQVLIQNLD